MITVVLAAFTMMAHAQIYVGGQLGFNSSSSTFKPNDGDDERNPRSRNFTIAPMAGYQVNEKLILGARLGFTQSSTTDFNWFGDDDRRDRTTGFGLDIFAQYTCLTFGQFSLLTEASLGFGMANRNVRIGSNTTHAARTSAFNFEITPVLAFDLNERIRLFANLNFLSIGFTRLAVRTPGDSDDRTVYNSFGFNFNSNNVAGIGLDLSNVGGGDIASRSHFITLGFLYKF